MSHVSKIELEVKDLNTLESACDRLGLQMVKGQQTFKWYSTEAGKCNHAIKVPDAEYEIGVIKTNDVFELKCDYFDSKIGVAIGKNGGLLKQAYAIEKTRVEARRKGYNVIERQTDNGVRLHIRVA